MDHTRHTRHADHATTKPQVTALRTDLSGALGPWGRPDMALFKFARAIEAWESIDVYGHGELMREFTYIDDLVGAIADLIPVAPAAGMRVGEHDSLSPVGPFRTVNIALGAPTTLMDFIAAIESGLGRVARKRFLPDQPGDVERTHADPALLWDLIGKRPQTPLIVGVAQFVAWYRDYYGSRPLRSATSMSPSGSMTELWGRLRADAARYGSVRATVPQLIALYVRHPGFRATALYRLGRLCKEKNLRAVGSLLQRRSRRLSLCDISINADIGCGVLIPHPSGVEIGADVVIGRGCTIQQNVTLGGNYGRELAGRVKVILGDVVAVSAGAVIAGPVRVGDRSIIGANAVVTGDVAPGSRIAEAAPGDLGGWCRTTCSGVPEVLLGRL